MKQKSIDQEVVTKGFLKSTLGIEFRTFREELIEEIDEKARKYRDQVLTKLDGVMGELESMREENTIGKYQTRELREEVDDHEKRISRLEKPHTAV